MLLCVIILGAAGWALGARGDMVTAWLLSGIGAVVGVYLGWRPAARIWTDAANTTID